MRMRKGRPTPSAGRFASWRCSWPAFAGLEPPASLIMRFDSGFWSNATIATIATIATFERLNVGYTMGVRMVNSVVKAVEAIDESAWSPIDYTDDDEAEVAQCLYKGRCLIVRRTRLVGRQATLWPPWRHFAFLTDIEGDATEIDAFHRAHATVELTIRDLKEGAGLEHVPAGSSSPTRRGSCARLLPMTSSAGPPCSARSPRRASSPWPAPCAPGSCRFPVGSSVARAARSCEHRSSGPGPKPLPVHSTFCEAFLPFPCSSALRGRAHRRRCQTALTTEASFTRLGAARPD